LEKDTPSIVKVVARRLPLISAISNHWCWNYWRPCGSVWNTHSNHWISISSRLY